MHWSSTYPDHPGYYLVQEPGGKPFMVCVDVESDSYGMFFVRLPDDNHKYPLDMWPGALWLGPFEAPPRSLAS